MSDRLTPAHEAEIRERAEAATPGPWGIYKYGGETLLEIAADLEETGCGYRARREIARLEDEPLDNDPTHREWTAEEDWEQVQADAEFIANAPEDIGLLLAELAAVRKERDELKRPAVVAKRNEIRQSYAELIATCEEAKDYEGAFDVQCRLPEREEQWKRVDEEAAS